MCLTKLLPAPQVLYPVPKPIARAEFMDALFACAPPRFPDALTRPQRRVGLAVSGGVDSMALAYLLNDWRITFPLERVADNPVRKIYAFIIDHRLRPGSTKEANDVEEELRKLRCVVVQRDSIDWVKLGVEGDPAALPNLESLARRARYRLLGNLCRHSTAESLFLAHHADDQYETVLMRLLAGHGSRGLRGIATRGGIPECEDMHNVHESGFIDNQRENEPKLVFGPSSKARRNIRRNMSHEQDWNLYWSDLRSGLREDWEERFWASADSRRHALPARSARVAAAASESHLPPIHTEEAGVMVYRPLLEFSKDRLIATCEANKMRWFEDETNTDPSLTMRNSVRHMVRSHKLPRALQKDNILRLAARCDERARAQEKEAERWIRRAVHASFLPNVGTLVAKLPTLAVPKGRPGSAVGAQRAQLRRAQRRIIAALLVRRLLGFVSPDKHRAQLADLQTGVVPRLFPALAEPTDPPPPSPRKAFNQAGVLFHPVGNEPGGRRWYLAREPYPSHQPLPAFEQLTTPEIQKNTHTPLFPPMPWSRQALEGGEENGFATSRLTRSSRVFVVDTPERLQELNSLPIPRPAVKKHRWYQWRAMELWDGRFWVRVRGRIRIVFRIAPYSPEHAKAFRESLMAGEDESAEKDEGDEDRGPDPYGPDDDPGRGGPLTHEGRWGTMIPYDNPLARLDANLKCFAPGKVRYTLPALYIVNSIGENRKHTKYRMVALPTLGVHLPGLERWMRYEVRYRKVEWELLDRNKYGEDERRFDRATAELDEKMERERERENPVIRRRRGAVPKEKRGLRGARPVRRCDVLPEG